MHRGVIRGIAIDVRRHGRDIGAALTQKAHQREIGIIAIQLYSDPPLRENLAVERADDTLGGRLRGFDDRLQPQRTQCPGRLRATGDGAQLRETFDKARPQRRLMLVDAAQDPGQAFAGDDDEIVEAAVGEFHRERQHLRAVRRVVDRHQRTTQHFGPAALEERAEHFQLAHFGDRDSLAFQIPLGHRGGTISLAAPARRTHTHARNNLHRFAQTPAPLRRVSVQGAKHCALQEKKAPGQSLARVLLSAIG